MPSTTSTEALDLSKHKPSQVWAAGVGVGVGDATGEDEDPEDELVLEESDELFDPFEVVELFADTDAEGLTEAFAEEEGDIFLGAAVGVAVTEAEASVLSFIVAWKLLSVVGWG